MGIVYYLSQMNNTLKNTRPLHAMAVRSFAQRAGYTHAEPHRFDTTMVQLYTVELCERCSCDIQGANSCSVVASLKDAEQAGLIIQPAPEEGGWNDDTGTVTCGSC